MPVTPDKLCDMAISGVWCDSFENWYNKAVRDLGIPWPSLIYPEDEDDEYEDY